MVVAHDTDDTNTNTNTLSRREETPASLRLKGILGAPSSTPVSTRKHNGDISPETPPDVAAHLGRRRPKQNRLAARRNARARARLNRAHILADEVPAPAAARLCVADEGEPGAS